MADKKVQLIEENIRLLEDEKRAIAKRKGFEHNKKFEGKYFCEHNYGTLPKSNTYIKIISINAEYAVCHCVIVADDFDSYFGQNSKVSIVLAKMDVRGRYEHANEFKEPPFDKHFGHWFPSSKKEFDLQLKKALTIFETQEAK